MRTPATRAARRHAYLLDYTYRQRCGGTGSRETVAADVVADMLLGLPVETWLQVLRTGLRDALEDQFGEGIATHLHLAAYGLDFYPESW